MRTGPIICDIAGTTLTHEDQALLANPAVGGVILFRRNFESIAQLSQLTQDIKAINPYLLIMTDHEGGRVQRFTKGFTLLPSLKAIAQNNADDLYESESMAHRVGWLLASELLAVGVDLSLAPVLDLDRKFNQVIGDRSFGDDPLLVVQLGQQLMAGMAEAGMANVAKHFPGHGGVAQDSHKTIAVDDRNLSMFLTKDMIPFIACSPKAILPAHILVPKVDKQAVTYSSFWLKQILRQELGYEGVVISDDLSMAAAATVGDYPKRVEFALEAGCDMVLICNCRDGVNAALTAVTGIVSEAPSRLKPKSPRQSWQQLTASEGWQKASEQITLGV